MVWSRQSGPDWPAVAGLAENSAAGGPPLGCTVSSSRVVTLERESGLWPLSITERSLLRRTRSFLAKLRVHMEARLTLSFSVALSVRRPHITAD